MPQWDFLDFVAEQGRRYPGFQLATRAEVTGLIEEAGTVVGVRAQTPEGPLVVRGDLVVGADGRHSTVRKQAGLEIDDLGAPMDVLWMRLSRRADDPGQTLGRIERGRIFIMLNRNDYWQCAFVIAKGGFEQIRGNGLPAFRQEITRLAPYVRDRTAELRDWDDVKLLSVAVDRLRVWHRPGLLCIGDAAHAMSPIGGVGINLAIQDAVAAANILCGPLLRGAVTENDLRAVQHRREFPTRVTQRLQVFLQNRVISRVLASRRAVRAPLALRLASKSAYLRGLPARIIGLGIRPEHVRTPAAA
jgi:2-polyprenyl-6-methoxyphenol hydroxylase-like FAD-dependent oxidoreductase